MKSFSKLSAIFLISSLFVSVNSKVISTRASCPPKPETLKEFDAERVIIILYHMLLWQGIDLVWKEIIKISYSFYFVSDSSEVIKSHFFHHHSSQIFRFQRFWSYFLAEWMVYFSNMIWWFYIPEIYPVFALFRIFRIFFKCHISTILI